MDGRPVGIHTWIYGMSLPASEFSNDMAHRDPLGEARLASLLSTILQEFSCP